MPDPDPAAPGALLDEGLCAFLAGGVSIGIGTRDARLRPHAVRALGGRRDGASIVLLVPRRQGRQVLDDVAADGRIAVVFSQPSTHRTVQLKGRDARVVPSAPGDRALALAYREALAGDLQRVGYPAGVAVALLEGLDEEVVAVAFTPDEGYDATPGPRAGAPLRSAG